MSPAEFHCFFDVVPAPVALLDSAFCFVDLNQAFKTRVGRSTTELIGANSLSVFQPTPQYATLLTSKALTTGEVSSAQVRCRFNALGLESVNADVRIAAINDLADRQYLLTLENIDAVPDRQPKSTSRDDLFESWISQSSMSISVQDSNYHFAIVNDAYCRLVGYSAKELIGRDPIDLLHPPEQAKLLVEQRVKLLHEVPSTVPGFARPREILHRSGRRVQFNLELICVKNPDGSMLWCSTLVDPKMSPSEGVYADNGSAEVWVADGSSSRFDEFSNQNHDAMIAVDLRRNQIVRTNPATAKMLGLGDQQNAGKPISHLWSKLRCDQIVRLETALRGSDSSATGKPTKDSELLVEVVLDSGAVRSLRFRFFNETLSSADRLIVVEDVTDDRSYEQIRLNEEREHRKILVRETHHRIKNNLQGVAGLIERASYRQPALKAGLDNVILQIRSIATVHGLQIESDNQVDLSQLAQAVADSIFKIFGFRIAVSVKKVRPDLNWVVDEHNAVPVALAISEMLTNATKHGAQLEQVSLEIELEQIRAIVRITNAGSLPQWFNLKHGADLLGGLKLIKALLPREGCELDYSQDGGVVSAALILSAPSAMLADSGP